MYYQFCGLWEKHVWLSFLFNLMCSKLKVILHNNNHSVTTVVLFSRYSLTDSKNHLCLISFKTVRVNKVCSRRTESLRFYFFLYSFVLNIFQYHKCLKSSALHVDIIHVGLHVGCPFLWKRVNSLVKLVNKILMDIGVVVLALLPANRYGKADGHIFQRHY